MDAKRAEKLKNIYGLIGAAGSLLWMGTMLMREMAFAKPPWLQALLGVMPNFGAFLLCVDLVFQFFPWVLKREFDPRNIYKLCGAVLGLMVLSEIVHWLFLGAQFDWFDLLAALLACLCMLGVYWGMKGRKAPEGGGA